MNFSIKRMKQVFFDVYSKNGHTQTSKLLNYCRAVDYTIIAILLTKTTAAQNGVALSYHETRGLHFLAVAFVATMLMHILKFYATYIRVLQTPHDF